MNTNWVAMGWVWMIAGLLGCARQEPANALKVGTTPGFPAFLVRAPDGSGLQGFDVDLAKAIAGKLGRPLQIKEMPFERLWPALAAGEIDLALAGMDRAAGAPENGSFSDPYFREKHVALAYAGNIVPENAEHMREMRVGAPAGSRSLAAAEKAVGQGHVRAFPSAETMVAALAENQLDCALLEESQAAAMLSGDSFLMVSPVALEAAYAAAIPKGKAEWAAELNAAIAGLAGDGSLDRLAKQWLVPAANPP